MSGERKLVIVAILVFVLLLLPLPTTQSWNYSITLEDNNTTILSDVLWNRSFDLSPRDQLGGLVACDDGGLVIAAKVSLTNDEEIWVIKTDASGNHIWNKTYWGGIIVSDIIEVNDGGYLVVARNPDGHSDQLIRLSESGTKIWNRTHHREGIDERTVVSSFVECDAGGFALAGLYRENPWTTGKAMLLRVDNNGFEQWRYGFGESGLYSSSEYFEDIIECSAGGFLLVGTNSSWEAPGYGSFYIIRTNENGQALWSAKKDTASFDFNAFSAIECDDGGFVIAGRVYESGAYKGYVMKIDQSGDFVWEKFYSMADTIMLNKVISCSEGGYAFFGKCYNQTWQDSKSMLLKTDDEGNIDWQVETSPPYGSDDTIGQEVATGGFILGTTANLPNDDGYNFDVWVAFISNDDPTTVSDTTTISSSSTDTIPDDSMNLILVVSIGGVAVLVIVVIFLKKR